MDTIFALASAQGKAGVAVVRISGPLAFRAGTALAGDLPEPRKTALRTLRDREGGFLDQALVLAFAEKASFTGEDTVELHLHGSLAVTRAVLTELSCQEGLRLADAGEFTRRALENGRIDLAQVEGLSDLIESETEAQRKQALRVFSGELGKKVDGWRSMLIEAASLLEATIDFADEEVPVDVTPDVLNLLTQTETEIRSELAGMRASERIREGFEVAIVGPPNAGKSTLLNYLSGRDAAITSEVAGTTRDIIEVRMDVEGLPVTLLDMAGLRETSDVVEKVGVARAEARAVAADLRVHLVPKGSRSLLPVLEMDILAEAKQDTPDSAFGVSGHTGQGVSELMRLVKSRLEGMVSGAGLVTRERHRLALEKGLRGLTLAKQLVRSGPGSYDLASEEIRVSNRFLESMVGRVDVEDLLDHIFSRFCVGK